MDCGRLQAGVSFGSVSQSFGSWGVVVLAGGSAPDDISAESGTRTKAMAPIGSRASILHALDALAALDLPYCVVAADEVQKAEIEGDVIPERGSQIMNARVGVDHIKTDNVIFVASDAPLIEPNDYRQLIEECEGTFNPGQTWFSVPFCSAESFRSAYPGFECSHLRFAGVNVMTGGLYACSASGFKRCEDIFERFSDSRKSQLGLALKVGLPLALPYFMGRLRIARVEAAASKLLEGQARLFGGYDPRIAIDFDTADQYEYVRAMLGA